jgi:hypothetical protein
MCAIEHPKKKRQKRQKRQKRKKMIGLIVLATVFLVLGVVGFVLACITFHSNLPLSGGTLNGTLNMNGQDITNGGQLGGVDGTVRPVDTLLSLANSSTAGNVPVFSTTTFQLVDSGSPLFTPSVFSGRSHGFPSPYTLGTPLSAASVNNVTLAQPASDWTYADAAVTYTGSSGQIFAFSIGCGFQTDTTGNYVYSMWLNGAPSQGDSFTVYAGTTAAIVAGLVPGQRVFQNGDVLQLVVNKGDDIGGNPVVVLQGMGFNLYRIG